ncbi:zinc ABC transporter solute-binding protein, partial [Arthrobacter deserti]|nr:zinc ABC transporter solute-binding protein [Arthrobacter deserti]
MRRSRFLSVLPGFSCAAGLSLLCLAAAGCAPAGTGAGQAPGGADDARISIVASTNVYGDIARTVGGDAVKVTSLITSPAQDPHSYEATARDKLAVSQADLVIENGGGYDSFLPVLVDDTGGDEGVLINAVEVSGLESAAGETGPADEETGHADGETGHGDGETGHADGETGHAHEEAGEEHAHGAFNEHVWYDLSAAGKVADAIAAKLAALDAGKAADFERNAAAFRGQLAGLEADRDALAKEVSGEAVAATDPVPLHLLEALGL